MQRKSESGVQGTDLALRVPLAGRCTKYWQMRRSLRRHCSTAGWPVASEKGSRIRASNRPIPCWLLRNTAYPISLGERQ